MSDILLCFVYLVNCANFVHLVCLVVRLKLQVPGRRPKFYARNLPFSPILNPQSPTLIDNPTYLVNPTARLRAAIMIKFFTLDF